MIPLSLEVRGYLDLTFLKVQAKVNSMSRPRTSSKTIKARPEKASKVSPEEIEDVFEFWKKTMQRRRTLLSEERKILLGAAIFDYGVDECKDAIRGCSLSAFHMGANKQRRRYDSLELIFRNSDRIESFRDLAQEHGPANPF